MERIKMKKIVIYFILTIVLFIYFIIQFPNLKHSFSMGTTGPSDFAMDYIGANQLLSGKTVYPSNFLKIYTNLLLKHGVILQKRLTQGSSHYKLNNHHPPFVDMLLSPFALLSFKNAAFLYSIVSIICVVLIIVLLLKSEDISLIYFPLIFLFVLAWPPFHLNLFYGQISILVTLFVTLAWFSYKKKHETILGIFIAFATMLKFYPGLLIIYLLIDKKYKALLTSIITIIGILVLTLILTKYNLFRLFFYIAPKHVEFFDADLGTFSINDFFSKLFLPMRSFNNTTALTIFVSPFLKNILFYISVGSLLFYLVLNIKKYTDDLGFSLFVILSLLLSPICFDHYFTLLLIPFVILMNELVKKPNTFEIIIFIVSLLFISVDEYSVYFGKAIYITHLYLLGNHSSFIDTLTFYSLQFYGILLLLFLNFRMIKKYNKTITQQTI